MRIFLLLTFISFSSSALDIQKQELFAPEPSSGIFEKEEVVARKFMVVTGHPLATKAAFKIIKKGGSAVDAAIAAQMVLNVVEPHASGIGGGGFLLHYDNKLKKSNFYNGRETAPALIDTKIFQDKKGNPKNFKQVLKGGASVGTPGLMKMLGEAHANHGKLPWFELFADAIDIASLGYELSPRMNNLLEFAPHGSEFEDTREMFFKSNGEAKAVDEIIYNPNLANTFRFLAFNGAAAFYRGTLAKNIVRAVQNSPINPGSLDLADFINYKPTTGNLICQTYRKYNICSMPMPSSGGVTMLQIMGILENFDLAQFDEKSLEAIHIISEAMRLSYSDRNKYTADDKFVRVPITEMLDKEYLKKRSFLINVDATLLDVKPGEFAKKGLKNYAYHEKIFEPPSTTHISIIDKQGNAVSFTSSIEYSFGSGITVNGFLLNNQLTDFSFISEKNGLPIANKIEGRKMPRSSMTPILVFDNKNRLKLVLGSPGGARIIAYVVKTLVGVLDWELPINEAVNLPNFTKMNDFLELEENTYLADYKESLEAIGHKVKVRDLTSGIHAIEKSRKGLFSGIDYRREGDGLGE